MLGSGEGNREYQRGDHRLDQRGYQRGDDRLDQRGDQRGDDRLDQSGDQREDWVDNWRRDMCGDGRG